MYRERASRLSGAVVWTRTASAMEDVRVLPDGCMDLIWSSSGDLLVAGPDTVAQIHTAEPGRTLTGLRFAPGIAPIVLGMPAQPFANRRVRLDELWRPSEVRRLVDRLAESPTPGHVLESLAADRLQDVDQRDVLVLREVVRLLRAGRGVTAVGEAVGLSARQLRRRSLDAFGYGPKTLARILRAQRAIGLAGAGARFADVAVDAGYADQAHLAREVRAFAGVSLTQLLG
jgi:AraC-like DNA-binding protein